MYVQLCVLVGKEGGFVFNQELHRSGINRRFDKLHGWLTGMHDGRTEYNGQVSGCHTSLMTVVVNHFQVSTKAL